MARELALGAAVLAARSHAARPSARKLIMQGLKEVTMHEVGHTLGLRHNFKASTLLHARRAERSGKRPRTPA